MKITNSEFMRALFGTLEPGEYCWSTSFACSPNLAGNKEWAGVRTYPDTLKDHVHGNTYFSVAKFHGTGAARRVKENFKALACVVLDDAKDVYLAPTWKLETSPGNYQIGFLLAEPIVDLEEAIELHKRLTKANAISDQDTNGNNPIRYVRLPVGKNTNAKYAAPFETRLVVWEPGVKVSAKDLLDALGDNRPIVPGNQTNPAKIEDREDDSALIAQIISGDSYHEPIMKLTARYARRGMDAHSIFQVVEGFMQQSNDGSERWHNRNDDILRTTQGAINKFGAEAMAARKLAQQLQDREVGEGIYNPLPELLSLQEMEERFVYVADGCFVFDRKNPKHLMNLASFKMLMAASTTESVNPANGKIQTQSTAGLWVKSIKRQDVFSLTFRAGGEFFTLDPYGRQCVNTWTGFDRSVDPGDASVQPFIDHVRYLFADRADDFLDWIAHIEQAPGVLPHTAWLHISTATGTGRGWLAGILARVFAGYSAPALDLMGTLTSGFNGRLAGKVFASTDEIREGGKGQWLHAEKLKELITAETREINPKYGRQSLEFNACRFLLFSNHRSAIPLTGSDRRMEVAINDSPARDEAYYSKLYQLREDARFVAAVARFLAERDIRHFNPGAHAKQTDDRDQVIDASTSEEQVDLQDCTDKYPYELASAEMLTQWAGADAFGGRNAYSFKRNVESCGWVRIARLSWICKGYQKRQFIYAKAAAADRWKKNQRDFLNQIPKRYGGVAEDVEWDLYDLV